jgi:biotin carboxylase
MAAAQPCVCVVDAYSSGSDYPHELRKRGFRSLHVQSMEPYPAVAASSFHSDDHFANIVFDGDLDACVARVRQHRPVAVICAMEPGVELADGLSERLGLASNGTALSSCRRQKLDMQTRIAEAGLRSIPTLRASDWPTIETWVTRLGRFPIVVKATASASSDHLSVCQELGQVRTAFDAIRSAELLLGDNHAVIVQPYVAGEEWCIQTASCFGHHAVTDIWREDKIRRDGTLIYDRAVLLPSTGDRQREAIAYTSSVLDALGIRHGAAHLEIRMSPEGPTLIEVGARVCGTYQHVVCDELLGIDQLSLSVDAYLDPQRFFARTATPYRITRHASMVFLISPMAGHVTALPRMDDVRALRSFHRENMWCKPGSMLARTIDGVTSPGVIQLAHADPEVVEEDYRRIRAWEADDFYRVG